MIGERMDLISMAHGLQDQHIKLSNLAFMPVILKSLQLMGLCMAVGMIASGTLTSIVSTLAMRSI